LIGVRVVNTVRHDPLDWSTFNRERPAGNQEIFHEFRYFVTAVRQQPVKAHADAEATRNPVKNGGSNERAPAPEKWRRESRHVDDHQKDNVAPIKL
jgi:hypothetical protein